MVTEFFWDTAAYAGAPVLAGDTPILSAGPVTGIGSDWTAPGWRTARSTDADPWAAGGGTALGPSVAIDPSGGLAIDGLEWMGARVYDSTARGILSVDPVDNLTRSWDNNPYAYAGNDPIHALDPLGLAPVTDSQLADYRNNNGIVGTYNAVKSTASTVANGVGHWFENNWEYVAGGAMVVGGAVLIATGVGGPAGMMLVSAGADTIIQKATTGEVNWGQVAVSGAAGAVGFGVGGAIAKTALSTGANTVLSNVGSSVAEGAFSGGGNYLTGSGPKTVSGLVRATASNAALDGVTAGIGHGAPTNKLLGKVEATVADGCFVAGTDVLLADGSSKAIEDVETDDEVLAYNPETNQTEKRRVVRTYVHEDKPTYDVVVEDGEKVTATSEHPFMVAGKGYTPVDEMEKGDLLVRPDGSTIEVLSVNATGETATVHNFEVEGLHNYYVLAGHDWILVHNDCLTRVRHYTSKSAADKIMEEGRIIASDQNKVFVTKAKEKLLGGEEARIRLGLTPGRGHSVIEFDVPSHRLEKQFNSRQGRVEHFIRGDVEMLNPVRVR
ncbi:polymorphic toxin-type HINT domain-containing protein [uncultured Friedmanniella sp.]|uniref:polymorphic toxin-type HINT domain-containing protein n=1 Tax=uncultured Friedmanniella sp. TaxID=335381 RepID=UPI0035CA6284